MKIDKCKIEKFPRRILGIDPGTGILGWGLIEMSGQKVTPLKYGCVRTPTNHPKMDRLIHIFRSLSDIIEKNKPDEVAIEELFFFKNQTTVISVAEARGVAIVAALQFDIPVFEYTPLQIKQALTGYGRADKKQMQEMVRVVCGLKECPQPDDAADAIAIAICHGQTNQKII